MRGLFAVLLASCASPGAPRATGEEGAPAVIVDPTPASRAALLQAVTDLLNGAQPLLADDALTRDSALLIVRKHLMGRELDGNPQRFRLLKSGDQCVLVRESTGQRAVLVETRCAER